MYILIYIYIIKYIYIFIIIKYIYILCIYSIHTMHHHHHHHHHGSVAVPSCALRPGFASFTSPWIVRGGGIAVTFLDDEFRMGQAMGFRCYPLLN